MWMAPGPGKESAPGSASSPPRIRGGYRSARRTRIRSQSRAWPSTATFQQAVENHREEGHIAGKTDHGFMVIEVWDSSEHIDRFMQSGLGAAMEEAQIPEPTITEFEVHKLDWAD